MLAVCGEQDLLPALRCPEATGLAKQLVDLRCTGQTVHAHNSGLRRNPVKNTGQLLWDSSHVDRKSKVFEVEAIKTSDNVKTSSLG